MPLTVAEKEHWRGRIAMKIERRVEALTAGDPGLFDRIKAEARTRALHSLGLAELQAELDLLGGERKALDRRENLAKMRIVARIKGIPVEEVPANATISYQFEQAVNAAVGRRQAVHERELLAEQELGRQVLRLREEQDNLLDCVWLAASSTQIRTLWCKVAELLGEEPSALEREALAIEPPAGG
jgi:hypothetical protein